MKKLLFLIGIIILLVVSNINTQMKENIFLEEKCNICHSINILNIKSMNKNAIDLSEMKYFKDISQKDSMVLYLTKKIPMGGKMHPITMKSSEDKINEMVEFLFNLNIKK